MSDRKSYLRYVSQTQFAEDLASGPRLAHPYYVGSISGIGLEKQIPIIILIQMFFALFMVGRTTAQIPAFPDACGAGAQSVGGRGGSVYEVMNLDDSGPGSLRAGCEMSGARTIVFRVSGTIEISSVIYITNPYLTIAGQTAPGGGIQVSGKKSSQTMIFIETHDIVIRYLRFRHGYTNVIESAISVVASPSYNIILDHCSMMWTEDESLSAWGWDGSGGGPTQITWSWNLVAEGLASHSTSLLTGGDPAVVDAMTDIDAHHNLFANMSHRNPLIKNKTFRFVNNIVYNWEHRASHTAGGVNVDFIGNLYKKGPLLESAINGHEIAVFPVSGGEGDAPSGTPTIYVQGNKGPFNTNPSNDNWGMILELAKSENGDSNDTVLLSSAYRRYIPLPGLPIPISADPVDYLETLILPTVGASQRLDSLGNWHINRDVTDTRIINEYNAGTGIIPTTENDVGGFPVIAIGTPCPDTDHDGMPDAWETAQGLNPNSAADGNDTTIMNPYTNLEAYLSGLYGSTPAIRNENKLK